MDGFDTSSEKTWLLLLLDLWCINAPQDSFKRNVIAWPRLWPRCARKRVDTADNVLQNPALFVDRTDVFDAKTLHITNRSQLAVMRSAVRSRLSPPDKSWNLTISGLFLYFLPQIIGLIFTVMRPDPDLTQTGAKTRWIYRDLFDKIARIYYFSIVFRIF